MYGEDSCGRKVSLLNDRSSSTVTNTRPFVHSGLVKQTRPPSSSFSSCASREGYKSSRSSSSGSSRHSPSPPTPPLLRYDSQSSISQSTPSPMTPQYNYEAIENQMKREQQQNAIPYYNPAFHRHTDGYPSLQDPTPQPYFHPAAQQALSQQPLPPISGYDLNQTQYDTQRGSLQPLHTQLQQAAVPYPESPLTQISPQAFQQTPTSATAPSTTLPPLTAATSTSTIIKPDPSTPLTPSNPAASTPAGKPPTAKKKYPCPHAARYSCTDTFTTSGHAARHGKKHTGEKNILCPTCHKAFTRKDNMKQHERTHKGGSSGSKSGSTAASPVISSKGGGGSAGSRKGSTAGSDVMDVEASDGVGLGLTMGGVVPRRPKMARSELSEIMEGITKGNVNVGMEGVEVDVDADGEGESPGLDALATAASELA